MAQPSALCLPPSSHLPFMSPKRRDSPAPGEASGREERAEQGPADCQGRNLPSSGRDANLAPHGNSRFERVPRAAASLSRLPSPQTLPQNSRAEMKLHPTLLPHTGLSKGYFLVGMSESWAQAWTACFFSTGEHSGSLSDLHSFPLRGLLPGCCPVPLPHPSHRPLKALQPSGSMRCVCWDWSPKGLCRSH